MARLAIRRELDQPAGAFLGLRQCRPAEAEPRRREALEPAHANVVEAPPPLLEPRPGLTLEQGPARDVIRDAGRAPGLRPLALRDVRLRAVCGLQRRLDIDERAGRQHELDLRSSGHQLGSDDTPQLREQDAQPRMVVGWRLLAVDGHQQVLAAHPPGAVEHEVREQQPAVVTRQGSSTRRTPSCTTIRPQSWILESPAGVTGAA